MLLGDTILSSIFGEFQGACARRREIGAKKRALKVAPPLYGYNKTRKGNSFSGEGSNCVTVQRGLLNPG